MLFMVHLRMVAQTIQWLIVLTEKKYVYIYLQNKKEKKKKDHFQGKIHGVVSIMKI